MRPSRNWQARRVPGGILPLGRRVGQAFSKDRSTHWEQVFGQPYKPQRPRTAAGGDHPAAFG